VSPPKVYTNAVPSHWVLAVVQGTLADPSSGRRSPIRPWQSGPGGAVRTKIKLY